MSSNIDKFGREYDKLQVQQKAELAKLKLLLKPDVYANLEGWCEITNAPAIPLPHGTREYKAGGLHTVPTKYELFHFLMDSVNPEEVKATDQPNTAKHGKAHHRNRTHR